MTRHRLLLGIVLLGWLASCSKEAPKSAPAAAPAEAAIAAPSMSAEALKAAKPEAGEIFYKLSFENALGKAQAENKLVMIDYYTTWCGPCKQLDKTTFKHPTVVAWLLEKAVPIKVDAEKDKPLAERYAAASYPTIIFAAPDGKQVGRISGYMPPKAFAEMVAKVLKVTPPTFPPEEASSQPTSGTSEPAVETGAVVTTRPAEAGNAEPGQKPEAAPAEKP